MALTKEQISAFGHTSGDLHLIACAGSGENRSSDSSHRECRPRQIRCRNAPQRPPSTPEETARAMADLQRMLRAYIRRDCAGAGGRRDEGESAPLIDASYPSPACGEGARAELAGWGLRNAST